MVSKSINDRNLSLRPGDIVCTNGDNLFQDAIRGVEKVWSKDDEVSFNHALILIDKNGTTFEALETVVRRNIYDAYKGCRIKIFRYAGMNDFIFNAGFKEVKKHEGNIYPAWRLLLALIPPLSKRIGTGKNLMCSELVSKFLNKCGVPGFYPYLGKTPDDVHDMCSNYKDWNTIYDIVL